ncbi:MAG TPA: ParB/RepB/Spo0J family partition protein [Pseudolabrys sp.]|nr:ParB/RepB/Spo0J family partition protein [Pseudolabrys sp.]
MAAEAQSRLGRGLAALMGDVGEESAIAQEKSGRAGPPRRVGIEQLRANPRNPRKAFSEAELNELATSIKERGVIQPIVVRALRNDPKSYEIIAGERRWRAAQRAGLHDVPIALVEATDEEALQFAIIENVQRADLNAIEEAEGYLALMEEYGHSQDEVAQIVGKSRPHIANTVRLLKLPDPVKQLVRGGDLSPGHARLLVGHAKADDIAKDIVARGLNVRQTEALMREVGGAPPRSGKAAPPPRKDPNIAALEKQLSDALGLQVVIESRGEKGTLHIHYSDLDQLDAVLRKLGRRA